MLSVARSIGLCSVGAYLVPHPDMVHPRTRGPLGAMVTGMTGIVAFSFRQRKVVITPRRLDCTSYAPGRWTQRKPCIEQLPQSWRYRPGGRKNPLPSD